LLAAIDVAVELGARALRLRKADLDGQRRVMVERPRPRTVLPTSQPVIRAPSSIALSSESARQPEPSIPVAETSL
jgi:hypothetical protein